MKFIYILNLFVRIPYVQYNTKTLQSKWHLSVMVGTIWNGALLSLPSNMWYNAYFTEHVVLSLVRCKRSIYGTVIPKCRVYSMDGTWRNCLWNRKLNCMSAQKMLSWASLEQFGTPSPVVFKYFLHLLLIFLQTKPFLRLFTMLFLDYCYLLN